MRSVAEGALSSKSRVVLDLHALWPYVASLCLLLLVLSGYLSYIASERLGIRVLDPLLGIVASVAVIAVHEFLHAAVAVAAGSVSVKFGVSRVGPFPVAYVSVRGGIPIKAYKWVTLAPLLVLTPALVLLAFLTAGLSRAVSSALLFAAVLNIAGSSGDLVIFLLTADCPPETLVEDKGTVVEVLAPKEWRPRLLPVLAWFSTCTAFLVVTAAFSLCLAAIAGGEASLGPVTLARVIIEYEKNRGFTFGCEVSPGTALLAAILSAAVIATKRPKPVYQYFAGRLEKVLLRLGE